MKIIVWFCVLVFGSCFRSKRIDDTRTFEYIVEKVRRNELDSLRRDYNLSQCARQVCCVCRKTFKNATYAAIHLALFHQFPEYAIQVSALFDKSIPKWERFKLCQNHIDVNLTIKQKDIACAIATEQIASPNVLADIISFVFMALVAITSFVYYLSYTNW